MFKAGRSMKFIEWKEEYNTNHKKMDSEHKKLIGILNKIYSALQKEDNDQVDSLLDEFKSLKEKHFESENVLMKKSNFPGYFSHKTEHDRAFNKLQVFVTNVKNNEAVADEVFLISMKTWFENHLELKDKKLASFLLSKK